MSSQFRPWMVMVNSFVTALVFMLAFTSALLWCLVATTHRSVVHAEGRFYCFCFASRYIRTKLHPGSLEEGLSPSGTAPQEGFQLGPARLNGREVRRIGRQEDDLSADGSHDLFDIRDPMHFKIIEEDDVAGLQGGNQHLLDKRLKGIGIDSPLYAHRSYHPPQAQRPDQREVRAMITRHAPIRACAAGRTRIPAGHGGMGTGFVHKDELFPGQGRHLSTKRRAFGLIALAGHQRFFSEAGPTSAALGSQLPDSLPLPPGWRHTPGPPPRWHHCVSSEYSAAPPRAGRCQVSARALPHGAWAPRCRSHGAGAGVS